MQNAGVLNNSSFDKLLYSFTLSQYYPTAICSWPLSCFTQPSSRWQRRSNRNAVLCCSTPGAASVSIVTCVNLFRLCLLRPHREMARCPGFGQYSVSALSRFVTYFYLSLFYRIALSISILAVVASETYSEFCPLTKFELK